MAATRKFTTDVVEGDGYARTRYHGNGKRGQPPLARRDLFDCRIALASLARAIESLEKAGNERLPQTDRDEHHRAALGLVGHVGRAIDDVLLRPHPRLTRRSSK